MIHEWEKHGYQRRHKVAPKVIRLVLMSRGGSAAKTCKYLQRSRRIISMLLERKAERVFCRWLVQTKMLYFNGKCVWSQFLLKVYMFSMKLQNSVRSSVRDVSHHNLQVVPKEFIDVTCATDSAIIPLGGADKFSYLRRTANACSNGMTVRQQLHFFFRKCHLCQSFLTDQSHLYGRKPLKQAWFYHVWHSYGNEIKHRKYCLFACCTVSEENIENFALQFTFIKPQNNWSQARCVL